MKEYLSKAQTLLKYQFLHNCIAGLNQTHNIDASG
jgi:hypothetical protein